MSLGGGWFDFFLAPFFGILSAFILERTYEWVKNRDHKKKLIENLKNELRVCQNLLKRQNNLVPVMMWNSTISSGDVKLLSFEERTKLASTYFEIEQYNYEAKRVRDSAVVAETGSRRLLLDGMTSARAYWVNLGEKLIQTRGKVRMNISSLLKEPFFKE